MITEQIYKQSAPTKEQVRYLESKIEEMRETISDLEAINDVNDQLQESAREEEKELRQNLDLSENRIREVRFNFIKLGLDWLKNFVIFFCAFNIRDLDFTDF